MKSMLRSVMLLSSILLIASCGNDVGNSVQNNGTTATTPTVGIAGRTVKGVISGATVTVTDKDGNTVDLKGTVTTASDGTFTVDFSTSAISASNSLDQRAPFVVTVDASGATATCDYKNPDGSGNDCPDGSGGYAAFGGTYTLENPLTLSCTLASFPKQVNTSAPYQTCNVSPASTLATKLAQDAAAAAGGSLTAAEVQTAQQQVLGLVQTLTGVDMSGDTLSGISLIDITNLSTTDTSAGAAAFALATFDAAVYGQVGGSVSTLAGAIAALETNITADPTSGNLTSTGTVLAAIASSISTAATIVYNQLTAAGVANSGAATSSATATSLASTYAALGGNQVLVPPPYQSGSTSNLDNVKLFIAKLADVIQVGVTDTGAAGQGGGVVLPLSTDLDSVHSLSAGTATLATNAFGYAVMVGEQQLANVGDTVDLSTLTLPSAFGNVSVTGTLEMTAAGAFDLKTDGTATATDPNNANISVLLTVPSGATQDNSTEIKASNVTLVVSDNSTSPATTKGTFTGSIDATYAPNHPELGLQTVTFDGTISGTDPATTFEVKLTGGDSTTPLSGVTSAQFQASQVSGPYTATFTLTSSKVAANSSPLSIEFYGNLHDTTQHYQVTAGSTTLMGTVVRSGSIDTDTITDGVVTLTAILDRTKNKTNGELTAPAQLTMNADSGNPPTSYGTVNAKGLVTYADGSIQSLPAQVF